ncbi:hypothetical protein SAMN03159494_05545 [Achromobacter sp. NFACC18-2]|nr:hypothetical protein SAMN03159494_05545 [Achromobacter sp. NFACC18-2]
MVSKQPKHLSKDKMTMHIKYVTDRLAGEPDILTPIRHLPLNIRTLDGDTVVIQQAPQKGWTHEALCAFQPVAAADGCEAFLGTSWVGSTEV